ncbi:MAG: hypothetical protein IAG10_30750 [Planctomycetaceae bacterium]|nr:hypothetical protein [Planctomycetaceae bacterium]
MRRSGMIAVVVFGLVGLLLATKAFALAFSEEGNKPQSELNYAQWKGIMPVVNDKARVLLTWVNGNEYLCYKGTTKELNVALAHFAKVEVKNHVVALRPGPAERGKGEKAISYNWNLHVLGGISRRIATDDVEDLERQKDPVLTVYVGGDIDLDKLEIPEGVTLRAAPGQSEEAKKDENARKKIKAFIEHRKSEEKK